MGGTTYSDENTSSETPAEEAKTTEAAPEPTTESAPTAEEAPAADSEAGE